MDHAEMIRAAARDLAQRIEAGLYAALEPHDRTDLRGLTLLMLGWADTVDDLTAERDEALRPTVRRALPRELQVARRGAA